MITRRKLLTAAAAASIWLALDAATAAPHAADIAYGAYLAAECTTCHRADGQDKGIPSIVGWPVARFVTALKSYKSKARPNPIMQTIASRLSDEDMAALGAYYATLKRAP